LARPISLLSGLLGGAKFEQDGAGRLDAELAADLALLNEPERRIVHSLTGALLQNRPE